MGFEALVNWSVGKYAISPLNTEEEEEEGGGAEEDGKEESKGAVK